MQQGLILLLTELVKENFRIDGAFSCLLHALKEEKHGCSQRLRAGQGNHEWILEQRRIKKNKNQWVTIDKKSAQGIYSYVNKFGGKPALNLLQHVETPCKSLST